MPFQIMLNNYTKKFGFIYSTDMLLVNDNIYIWEFFIKLYKARKCECD